jgi:hypothetical protein
MAGLAPVTVRLTGELLLVRVFVTIEAGAMPGMIVGRFLRR